MNKVIAQIEHTYIRFIYNFIHHKVEKTIRKYTTMSDLYINN